MSGKAGMEVLGGKKSARRRQLNCFNICMCINLSR